MDADNDEYLENGKKLRDAIIFHIHMGELDISDFSICWYVTPTTTPTPPPPHSLPHDSLLCSAILVPDKGAQNVIRC